MSDKYIQQFERTEASPPAKLEIKKPMDPNSVQFGIRRLRNRIVKILGSMAIVGTMTYGTAELGENYVADQFMNSLTTTITKPIEYEKKYNSWGLPTWDTVKHTVGGTIDDTTKKAINTAVEGLRGPARSISWWIGSLTGLLASITGLYAISKISKINQVAHPHVTHVLVDTQQQHNKTREEVNEHSAKIQALENKLDLLIKTLQNLPNQNDTVNANLQTQIRLVVEQMIEEAHAIGEPHPIAQVRQLTDGESHPETLEEEENNQ